MAKTPKQKIVTRKHADRVTIEKRRKRWLTGVTAAIGVIVFGLVAFGLIDQFVLQARRPVAKVGEQTISLQQFQDQVRISRSQIIQQYLQTQQFKQYFGNDANFSAQIDQTLQEYVAKLSEVNADILGQEVLDQMVNNQVISQEAQKMGVMVSKEEVETELQSIFAFYPNGTTTPTITATAFVTSTLSPEQLAIVTITPTPTEEPTATTLPTEAIQPEATLAEGVSDQALTPTTEPTPGPTSTPYTLEGYQKQVKTYEDELAKSNMNLDAFRTTIQASLLRAKMLKQITADMKPEEEQVWARHILVADESTAKDVYSRLGAGEDFAALAAEKSTDPSNKDRGGDLDWLAKGNKAAAFEDAAFSLAIGEISQPVQAEDGWHIIQVLGHEIRPITESQLDALRQKKFDEWLATAKSTYTIGEYDYWKGKVPMEPVLQQQ